MANKDVAILIVFPDYLISVNTPVITLDIPDLLPGVDVLPKRVKIPATRQKLKHLGHAGILFIDGTTGLTRYYEYGRYDPAEKGLVRKQQISDVKIGKNGRPTKESLRKTLGEISVRSGQRGRIAGAYIELPASGFIRMQGYVSDREKRNIDPKRPPYDLLSNSCLHFMKQVAEAGGAQLPPVLAPHPAGYILQVQIEESDVEYTVTGQATVEDLQLD